MEVSKVFKQKYYGNLTLVPRFTTLQLFGLKSLVNPTVSDMEIYLQNGQIAAWPFLCVLKEMLRVERSINTCLAKLEHCIHSVPSGFKFSLANDNDDVDSLSSAVAAAYRARLPGLGREAELLKEKVYTLERENVELRKQVVQLQRAWGISHSNVLWDGNHDNIGRTLEGHFVSVPRGKEDSILEEDSTNLEKKSL